MTITFTITGEPKAQPRARAFARKMGDKFVARVYDAGTAEGWKSAVAEAARPHLPASPLDGPLALRVAFFLSRPRGHYGSGRNAGSVKASAPVHHTGKPDLDNLVKAVKDALTRIGMWRDDAQVVVSSQSKDWAKRGGATVEITPLREPQQLTLGGKVA